MTYPENLSLVELAGHYARYKDDKCLEELARRDKLSQMTYDERMGQRFEKPDNPMVFDFHKEDLVSSSVSANNVSVKDSDLWKEVYESGFRAGAKHGLKIAQDITKIPPGDSRLREGKKNENR